MNLTSSRCSLSSWLAFFVNRALRPGLSSTAAQVAELRAVSGEQRRLKT